MKQCSTCKVEKPLVDFNKKSSTKDGFERYCKDCHRARNRKHYDKNKTSYIESAMRWKREKRKWWEGYKKQFKCIRCGEDKPWRLAFHHLDPSEKEDAISAMISANRSVENIVTEINKCVPVCHNCHSDIHHEQHISR